MQYMFNTPDCDVVRFLRLLTFLDMAEVAAIEAALGREDYVPNTAQRRLAEEVRSLCMPFNNGTGANLLEL